MWVTEGTSVKPGWYWALHSVSRYWNTDPKQGWCSSPCCCCPAGCRSRYPERNRVRPRDTEAGSPRAQSFYPRRTRAIARQIQLRDRNYSTPSYRFAGPDWGSSAQRKWSPSGRRARPASSSRRSFGPIVQTEPFLRRSNPWWARSSPRVLRSNPSAIRGLVSDVERSSSRP